MKSQVYDEICLFLLKSGFTIKCLTKSSFDIVARNNEHIILLKILNDASAITENYALDMKRVSGFINASPIIIAEKASSDNLEENIVYSRFSVPTLTVKTFIESIKNGAPILKKSNAGIVAHLNGPVLRNLRESQNLSLQRIARVLGVSPEMIIRYESGQSEITLQRAQALYELFGKEVFTRVNLFSPKPPETETTKDPITLKYIQLGFEATHTHKAPFDFIAKKDSTIIFTEVEENNPQCDSLANLVDASSLIIFTKQKPEEGLSMSEAEFLELETARELIEFLD